MDCQEQDVRDKDYHIEDNGKFIIYNKPIPERFPVQYSQPPKTVIADETQLIQESSINKSFKEKRSKGGIAKEENLEYLSALYEQQMT